MTNSFNNTANRPRKNGARSVAVMNERGVNETAEVALFFPGLTLNCVKEALAQKTISLRTKIIAVERNREIAAHIAKALKELGFKRTYVHVGPLHTLWLDDILRAGQAVNYLFLDLCGQFTTHVARWILFNQHRFAFDAVIAATYTIQKRCNPLLDAIYAGRFMIVGRLPGNRTLFMLKTNVREWTRTTLFGHIAVLEQNYNVEVLDCIEYNDTSPMVMIRCQLGGSRRRTSAVTQAFNTLAGDLLRVNPELPTAASPKPRSITEPQSPKRGFRKLTPATHLKRWQLLRIDPNETAGNKAAAVRRARKGFRPITLNAAQWACCPLNPRSHYFDASL